LGDDSVARRECRCHLVGPELQRVVEGNNGRDDTHRLVDGKREAVFLPGDTAEWQALPKEPLGLFCVSAKDADRDIEIPVVDLPEGASVLQTKGAHQGVAVLL